MWPTRRTRRVRPTAWDGSGIGVGVLSDGVVGIAAQQATGDVPAQVTILPEQAGGAFDLSCNRRSAGAEGTAMFEIVHDLAPGAELFFATGGGGAAQMAQNIEDLCDAAPISSLTISGICWRRPSRTVSLPRPSAAWLLTAATTSQQPATVAT